MKLLMAVPVLFMSGIISIQAQKFTFKLGAEYGLPRKTEDLAFLGNDKDGIVNLSLKKDELNIVRFDAKSLNQTNEKRIELAEASRNFNSEELVTMENNYFWLHSDWDKGTEREMLYYDKIDVASGKITEANHKMHETTRLGGEPVSSGFYRYKLAGKYKFSYDVDQKKLLVSYRLHPEERNDKKNFDKIGLQFLTNI